MKNKIFPFILILIFFPVFLFAQSNDHIEPRSIRVTWSGGDNALQYQVIIERNDNGNYRRQLSEYTESTFLIVSLLPGEYRYRVIPYDIINRPFEGTQWINFEIINVQPPEPEVQEKPEEIQEYPEELNYYLVDIPEEIEDGIPLIPNSPRFNSIGFSGGSSFTAPLYIASAHFTFAPIDNMYVEIGYDYGFNSNSNIEYLNNFVSFYNYYPYINMGYFMPFKRKGGLFLGAGGGYMTVRVDYWDYDENWGGQPDFNIIAVNLATGLNLGNFFNISYMLIINTNFKGVTNKVSLGLVYRFLKKEKNKDTEAEYNDEPDENLEIEGNEERETAE